MGASQIAQMLPNLREVYEGITGPDDPPKSLCTLEAVNLANEEVWIQVNAGNVNMVYPHTEDPLELLRRRGVRSPSDIYLVEWVEKEYAAFGFGNIAPRDHAFFVDQLFVKVLGCEDEHYKLKISIEPLDN